MTLFVIWKKYKQEIKKQELDEVNDNVVFRKTIVEQLMIWIDDTMYFK